MIFFKGVFIKNRPLPSPTSVPVSDPAGEELHVKAKYPVLLLKQQLTAHVEKIYGNIWDNLKKDVSPLITLCIQVPRTSYDEVSRSPSSLQFHWQNVVDCLNLHLNTLKDNYVPSILVQRIFCDIFSVMNAQLFNSLLVRRECCSFTNGTFVKAGLAELEKWCFLIAGVYAASSYDELKHVRQVVRFLVTDQKPKKSYDEIANSLCPDLSPKQLYRICILYWDDKYGTHGVNPDVISTVRKSTEECLDHTVGLSFLLDDDDSIPFSVDDISSKLEEKDFSDVKPVGDLLKNPAFQFLQD